MRSSTDYIVVHCSATAPSDDIGVDEIRRWHVEQNGWRDVGYHFVIRRSGSVEEGRPVNATGAHAKGFNTSSVGVCLVGGVDESYDDDCNFTHAQYESLRALLITMQDKYPNARVLGHRDLPGVRKSCPCFDAVAWWSQC